MGIPDGVEIYPERFMEVPFFSMVVKPGMYYKDIKVVGTLTKDFLEDLYGKCPYCGFKMLEGGKICSIFGDGL